jgi:aminoglycoside phosphotransferase (APT) family kinase protein
MEFVPGRIFHDPAFPSLNATDRRDCWRSAIKSLTTLHSVDVKKLDLPDSFKKLSGSHYSRQLSTLAKVTESQAKVRNQSTNKPISMIPKFYEITQWMKQNMPPLEQSTMVHGDYKIDNLIYHPTENRVVAILDWELCTTGHPLADLGNLLQPYSFPSIPTSELKIGGLSLAKKLDGLPTLKENLADYKSLCNWDPAKYWTFAVVYAHLRLAVIVHGIKARHARDQASSAHAGDYAKLVPVMASLAWKEIENSKKCEHKL